MKDEWKIADEFVPHGIQCFIAKWERGERPDKDWAFRFHAIEVQK